MRNKQTRGFTLVELSIVLVIIGLLIGGILGGQELIRSSELNSITSDITKFKVGVNAFKLKYNGFPGDMTNATAYWGTDASGCPSGGGIGTCNGDGDGRVSYGWQNGNYTELFRFWQQLALSGILPGNFTGVAGSGGGSHFVADQNAPSSKMNGGVYSNFFGASPTSTSSVVGMGGFFDGDYGNFISIGQATTTGHPWSSFLIPADAMAIDTKVDDGRPGMGKVFSTNSLSCATTAVSSTAAYAVSLSSVACIMHFAKIF
jgi:prepilin-type N-terminal cleavage/methylation domain-containing protein